ncbi:MAG: SufE family protein [Opitutales bacterium]
MTTIEERTNALLDEMLCFDNSQDRFEYVISKYKSKPSDKTVCIEDNLVKGCVSNLWLSCAKNGDICEFKSEADSLITKAIANLVCDFYNGLNSQEILEVDTDIFENAQISSQLSPNRRNGLSKLLEKIRDFAKSA